MFIGHFAPAFAAAAVAPRSIKHAPMLLAGQLVDVACFSFILAGIEKIRLQPGITVMNPFDLYHMPYTHSLIGTLVWAGLFGLILNRMTGERRVGWLGALVVLSHWFLDVLVHSPDMTLHGAPPKIGLGLWNHPWIEMPLELTLTFGALVWWARASGAWTRARGRVLTLAGVLLTLQLYSWFSPQPTELTNMYPILALTAFAIVIATGGWVDKGMEQRKSGSV